MTTAERQALAGDPRMVALARRTAACMCAVRHRPRLTDDATGAALLALVESAARFDPAEGVPFRLYARQRVAGAVLDLLRHESPRGYGNAFRRGEDVPLVGSIEAARAASPEGWEPADPRDDARRLEDAEAFNRLATSSGVRGAAAVLRLRYGDGLDWEGVAAALGRSVRYATEIHSRAIRELQWQLRPSS